MGVHKLPEELREKLAQPLGRLFTGPEVTGSEFHDCLTAAAMVITVGDKVTETVNETGRVPDIHIIDAKERRFARVAPDVPFKTLLKAKNPAGTITDEAIETIISAFGQESTPVRVLVDGEEDLLAIPALVFAPTGAVLLYGQPKVGVVMIRVDRIHRASATQLMKQMGISTKGKKTG